MTDHQTLYTGVSRAAWGYFFLYFNINLGRVSILPSFVAFLLFLSSISLLKEERRDLVLLRPFGILLAVWHCAEWSLSWVGGTLDGRFEILGLLIGLASLYFHFQLFTDFAALAAKYQQPDDNLDRRLLRWRTIQTVLLTVMTLMAYPAQWFSDWWDYVVMAMVVVYLIAGLCLMMALFALRKLFADQEPQESSL